MSIVFAANYNNLRHIIVPFLYISGVIRRREKTSEVFITVGKNTSPSRKRHPYSLCAGTGTCVRLRRRRTKQKAAGRGVNPSDCAAFAAYMLMEVSYISVVWTASICSLECLYHVYLLVLARDEQADKQRHSDRYHDRNEIRQRRDNETELVFACEQNDKLARSRKYPAGRPMIIPITVSTRFC